MAQQKATAGRHVWQALAALVAAEQDPEKVLLLSKELVKALDEDSKQQLDRASFESKKRPMSEKGDSGLHAVPPPGRANPRVRCPYCGESGKFREMAAQSDGVMVCSNCGHTTLPLDPEYSCNCRNCGQLAMFTAGH